MAVPTRARVLDTPIGPVVLAGDGDVLARVLMGPGALEAAAGLPVDGRALPAAAEQLADWFTGDRTGFDLALAPPASAFAAAVRAELCRIPYGGTVSYGELATRLGDPGASRAVGLACGRNPVGIVVPCHRVVGADGTLTGFGGGLPAKRWLLAHEQRTSGATLF
jgi:methylated-DNA-[protein]-cysteine S-methyltransferase